MPSAIACGPRGRTTDCPLVTSRIARASPSSTAIHDNCSCTSARRNGRRSRRSTLDDRSRSGSTPARTLAASTSRNAAKTSSFASVICSARWPKTSSDGSSRTWMSSRITTQRPGRRHPAPPLSHFKGPEPIVRRLDTAGEHSVGIDTGRAKHLAPRPKRRCTLGLDDRRLGGRPCPVDELGEELNDYRHRRRRDGHQHRVPPGRLSVSFPRHRRRRPAPGCAGHGKFGAGAGAVQRGQRIEPCRTRPDHNEDSIAIAQWTLCARQRRHRLLSFLLPTHGLFCYGTQSHEAAC
jgi:hypothetical protein